ncbi:MAG: hypothetical protein GY724_19730 [Actinomycetia bacterium]|nr:hypothetical protein [Actinomycetes bacterium]
MVEVSTPALGSLARPPYRRSRLLLRRQLRLRFLGRRLLGLAAAVILLVAGDWLPLTGSDRSTEQAGHLASDPGPSEHRTNLGPNQGPESLASGPQSRWDGLTSDQRAVAIATPLAPLPLEVGDQIELVGVAADREGVIRVETLTPTVVVLAVSPQAIVVAVPALSAPRVIEYQASGVVEMVAVPRAELS